MLIRVFRNFKGQYIDSKGYVYDIYEIIKQEKIGYTERVLLGICSLGITEIINLSHKNFNTWHIMSKQKIKKFNLKETLELQVKTKNVT